VSEHIRWMDNNSDAKTLTASPLEVWKGPSGHPRITWMKTILDDLRCYKLILTEAIYVAHNWPLWRLVATSGATQSFGASRNDMTMMEVGIPQWRVKTDRVTKKTNQ